MALLKNDKILNKLDNITTVINNLNKMSVPVHIATSVTKPAFSDIVKSIPKIKPVVVMQP